MTSLDEDTAKAVAALAHRIRERDAASEPADAEIFSLEFMTALRGQGWRPTPAKAGPSWKRPTEAPAKPNDDFKAAKAQLERLRGGGHGA